MEVEVFLIDIAKYALAGGIVATLANWLFWSKYSQYAFQLKVLEKRHASAKEILPLRLQAYERLVLFTERIRPSNLLIRLYETGLNAAEFEQRLVSEIRAEYQHNVTQQLYVSDAAWSIVTQLKDNTVALIRNATLGLPASAGAKDLSSVIFDHLAALEDDPYMTAVKAIKSELGG